MPPLRPPPPRPRRHGTRPSPFASRHADGGPRYKPPRRDAPQGVEHDEFGRGLIDAARGALVRELLLSAPTAAAAAPNAQRSNACPWAISKYVRPVMRPWGCPDAARRLQRRPM